MEAMGDRLVFGTPEAEAQKRHERELELRRRLQRRLEESAELCIETGISVDDFAAMIYQIWYVYISGDYDLEIEWADYWIKIAEQRGALPRRVYEWRKHHKMLVDLAAKTVGDRRLDELYGAALD
jgi:hypothetical protein